MAELVTNASVDFKRVTQAQMSAVERFHDEHSQDIEHSNDTIDYEDTELNYHRKVLDLNELLDQQYGEMVEQTNQKLDKQLSNGKISQKRHDERSLTIDDYLNHKGKEPKRAFTLTTVYVGDLKQTKQKLDMLSYSYETKKIKGKDGQYHTHFHLTNPKERQEWRKLWIDTFSDFVNAINNVNKGVKIFDYSIHLDEASPHLHMKMLNMGHTKKGRPSYDLNQSLSDFLVEAGSIKSPLFSRKTAKTPDARISGISTLGKADESLSRVAAWCFGKHFDAEVKLEHKGADARITNQMSPDEFKQYMANLDALRGSYTALTGKKANSTDSPLKLSEGIRDASRDVVDQTDTAKKELAQIRKQAQTVRFNSFVQQEFIRQLEQRKRDKLRKMRQREEQALQKREDELTERVTKRVLDGLHDAVEHVVNEVKMVIKSQLDGFNSGVSSAEHARHRVTHNTEYNQKRLRNLANNLNSNKVIGDIVKQEEKRDKKSANDDLEL